MSKRTITRICVRQYSRRQEERQNRMENILNIQYIICSKHELMCCGCVQWYDTNEPLVVVVMNNIVPPTVQSVSMADRQRGPSREEESVLVKPGPEATQDVWRWVCLHVWN